MTLRSIISFCLFAVIGYLVVDVCRVSEQRQEIAFDQAELHHVKYGLLNVHHWRDQVADILTKKIRNFELTTENRKDLKVAIENTLHKLLKEVEKVLESKKKEGGFFKRALTGIVQSLVFDLEELERKIPEFSDVVLDELENYESREKMRKVVQQKIDELLLQTVGEENRSVLDSIVTKYGAENVESCQVKLNHELTEKNKYLRDRGILIVLLSLVIILILLLKNKHLNSSAFIVLIGLALVLLYGGVKNPMIDIDARIDHFSFLLMGEPLVFTNQILFFQSKSILDVVWILLKNTDYQSILVGVLIFLFSILFPLIKLTASSLLLSKGAISQNKIVRFLALKIGKWSMADVFIIAIFMAYIGFSGIIGSQLHQLEKMNQKAEMLTTDRSHFGVGFILFLSFTIVSLLISTFLSKKGD